MPPSSDASVAADAMGVQRCPPDLPAEGLHPLARLPHGDRSLPTDATDQVVVNEIDSDDDDNEASLRAYYEGQEALYQWAFCCLECKCSDKRKSKFGAQDVDSAAFGTHPNGLMHRRCCHSLSRDQCGWKSPIEKANESFCQGKGKSAALPPKKAATHQVPTLAEEHVDSQDRKMGKVTSAALMKLNPVSATLIQALDTPMFQDYDRLVEGCADDAPLKKARVELKATVLDLFAGTGAGLVALKRQGISVGTYVYVEHCPVVTYVFRWNHDPAYNPKLPDEGIRFVYYRDFVQLDAELTGFMRRTGPIDIIFAAPPCVDFALINAHRKGIEGHQGRLTPMVADLIERVRRHRKQAGRALFFVVENVISSEVERALRPLGVTPVKLQAALYSPTFRDRYFWTNIRPDEDHFNPTSEVSASLDSCVEDRFMSLIALAGIAHEVANKAPTFMASKSRHNPGDSFVCRFDGTDLRPLTGIERGRAMGFPEGYASVALEALFRKLSQVHAYTSVDQLTDPDEFDTYFSLRDDPGLRDFRGEKIQCTGFDDASVLYQLKLYLPRVKPDVEDEDRQSYGREEYEKRIWGNAWNIPTMEKLLIPLKRLFASKTYQGYPYPFRWQRPT
jgi:C-5 cytosine-specific DNA methylase